MFTHALILNESESNGPERSLAPPKDWWDRKYKEVKTGNPDYSEEQIRKTIGAMWYHEMSKGERKEKRKAEGKEYGKPKNEFDPQKAYEDLTPEEKKSYAEMYDEAIQNPGKVDEALWKKAVRAAEAAKADDIYAFASWWYKHHGGEFHKKG